MVALTGYFDGNVCIPLSTEFLKPRQKVIITALDEFLLSKNKEKKSTKKESCFGALKDKITYIAPDFDAPIDDFAEYMQ